MGVGPDIRQFTVSDAAIMRGAGVFRGTRVPLRTVRASLTSGDSLEMIVQRSPSLTREQVEAARAFAAASAREALPPPRLPAVA
jgi:uncharacterized protein (DUF433 family)